MLVITLGEVNHFILKIRHFMLNINKNERKMRKNTYFNKNCYDFVRYMIFQYGPKMVLIQLILIGLTLYYTGNKSHVTCVHSGSSPTGLPGKPENLLKAGTMLPVYIQEVP